MSPRLVALIALIAMPLLATAATDLVPVATNSATSHTEVTVLRHDDQGYRLQLHVPSLERETVELAGRRFDQLSLADGGVRGEVGELGLPTLTRLVVVPAGMTVTARITHRDEVVLDGLTPAPVRPIADQDKAAATFDLDAYRRTPSRPVSVSVGEVASLHGLRVAPVTFAPVGYDAATGQVTATATLEVELNHVTGGADTPAVPSTLIPESFATLYEQTVIGWTRGDDVVVGPGRIIYVCPDNSTVVAMVEDLAKWRRRQGYVADVVTTAEAGTTNTAIRSWLSSQYVAAQYIPGAAPLEFVVLVGDANGTIAIPTFIENTSGYYGEGDHDYSRLDGDDVLPDVHVGRISVRTTTELQTAVDKILDYERQPDLSETSWFTTAGLTGDPSTSGYSCIFTNQFVKQELLRLGYTQVDTIWSGNFTSLMMNTINQGETMFTYRGLGGMSGMNSNHITYTTNGRQLPFAVILTCDTGSFMDDTTARSEAWLRAPNGGGIGSIGTSTIGTHTRYNNCMFLGITDHLLCSGDFRLGPALSRGKLNFYINYWQNEQSKVWTWMTWNNLMGDPATEMWTGVPAALDVDYPTVVATSANALPVNVTAAGQPVAGARVAVVQDDGLRSVGYTDASGHVLLPLDGATAGDLNVTVTGHDLYPHRGATTMGAVDRSLDLQAMTVADGGGNGDGVANPGEGLRLSLQLVNGGTTVAPNATAQLVSGPDWAEIDTTPVSFGSIAGGATAWGSRPWDVSLSSQAPGGDTAVFELVATSGDESWSSQVVLPVDGPRADIQSVTWDVDGGRLDPGDTGGGTVTLENLGNLATNGATGTLSSNSRWVQVTQDQGHWSAMDAGGTTAQTDAFAVAVDPACYPGHLAAFTLELTFAEGGTQTLEFTANVGLASAGDPTGPDAYGYHAFSDDDTDPLAPGYDWVDILALGQNTGLTDEHRWDDEVTTVDLPFAFTYYGHEYDEVTICTNGWLAFGRTDLKFYRNWTLPADGAPDAMVAAFWDDLAQGSVFTWHDTANHRFVVQWDGFSTWYESYPDGYYDGECTFQIILTDPAHSETQTGDGRITMQYETVTVSNDETTRFTTGLQNHDRTVGLTYAYGNHYAGGAATVTAGRAITFVPVVTTAHGTLQGAVSNLSSGGGPIDGARVSVLGGGYTLTTGADGHYSGSAPVGTWDVMVSHPSCEPDTVSGVVVVQNEATSVDFELTDIAGPAFAATTVLESTMDTAGPYVVETLLDDITGVAAQQLVYTSSSTGGPYTVPLVLIDAAAGRYRAEIPGQALGTRVQYWLTATDVLGLTGADPVGAPWPCYSFQVADIALLSDQDFESGAGGWQVNADGNDNELSGAWVLVDPIGTEYDGQVVNPEDDHTAAPGTMCWVTGQHVEGQTVGYADVDGGPTTLWSPVWDASTYSRVTLSYWRWFTNDVGSNPSEDPWLVEISNDGGASWQTVENTLVSNTAWQQVSVDVAQFFADPDQLRLRCTAVDNGYGSLVEAAVDDVRVSAITITPDTAAPTVSLTSPTGGETYSSGQSLPITWTAADDVGVVEARVYVSLDGGATWGEPVVQGALNGSAPWTVAVPASTDQARVRVDVLDSEERRSSDMSAVFTLSADITDVPAAATLQLAQNQPNPFNPQTVIAYSLPRGQRVTLRVYDVQGRRVRTLVSGEQTAGHHRVIWRGQDDAGQTVSSGTYFYRLSSDGVTLVKKMLLVK